VTSTHNPVPSAEQPPESPEARARTALESVMDPEVPVLSVIELGIVRDIVSDPASSAVTVTVTPTYSGCPAMHAIEAEITAALRAAGFRDVALKTVYAPAWTTDWIAEPAREKLRSYGIAPPGPALTELVPLGRAPRRLACPFCGSADTSLVSEFGATACKSLYSCHSCRQPFEHFKPF
jgi:ring-1,2-phenylacetyl-CoA epoxidase subunit PaaD